MPFRPTSYRTADNLAVLPENESATVEAVAKWMGYTLDQWFVLEPIDAAAGHKPIFPTPCSIREALTCYCDLQGIPSRRLLGSLSHYAKSDKDRSRLQYVSLRWWTWD